MNIGTIVNECTFFSYGNFRHFYCSLQSCSCINFFILLGCKVILWLMWKSYTTHVAILNSIKTNSSTPWVPFWMRRTLSNVNLTLLPNKNCYCCTLFLIFCCSLEHDENMKIISTQPTPTTTLYIFLSWKLKQLSPFLPSIVQGGENGKL